MNTGASMLYLSREDIMKLGGGHSDLYVDAVSRALTLHAAGDYVQPLKPYLRVQEQNGHIADRIIAMPAHLGGAAPISGIKWIGSKHDNPAVRGVERASGVIILNDSVSNYPVAVLEASLISGMRTAAVTVVGARHFARSGFATVSCIGCGAIARMQLLSLLEQFPAIKRIYLFDLNTESANRLASELIELYSQVTITVTADAESAVRQGEVVVTCTVVDQPYIPMAWIGKGTFVSNISIMDLHKDVFLQADKVVVDDWQQANREKKTLNQLVLEGKFSQEQLYAELGEVVSGAKAGRENEDEIIVLNPMGMAVEDIASAHEIYQRAVKHGIGTVLDLFGAKQVAVSSEVKA
jgi:2,3-diaminopropionate biosynthesis protein SbnB